MSWRVIEVPTIIMGGEQIANGSKHDDGIGFSFRIANFVSSHCCTKLLLVPFLFRTSGKVILTAKKARLCCTHILVHLDISNMLRLPKELMKQIISF